MRLVGGVAAAVTTMRRMNKEMPTEVEAQSLDQVDEALRAEADVILLDNLTTPDIIEAVKRCRGHAKTEISGGVTLQRLPELAATGADYVSIGALTHSAPAVDLERRDRTARVSSPIHLRNGGTSPSRGARPSARACRRPFGTPCRSNLLVSAGRVDQ